MSNSHISNKRGSGRVKMPHEHDMQSLSASLTEGCQMSSSFKTPCEGEPISSAQQPSRGYCPPRRTEVPVLDLFEPGKITAAIKKATAVTAVKPTAVPSGATPIVGKPSVPVGSTPHSPPKTTALARASGSTLGRKGVLTNAGGQASGGNRKEAPDDGVGDGNGSSGGVSRLKFTMKNIKIQKKMPKPSGSTTEVRLTTIFDDVEEVCCGVVLIFITVNVCDAFSLD